MLSDWGDTTETVGRLGRDRGETGERLEWNMERLGERRQFEESWGQEYIMETGGKMDCTDNSQKIILYRLW